MIKYDTKQKRLIIDYLKNNYNECLTVGEIRKYFNQLNENIGQATIYRCLKELEKNNEVIKYQNGIQSSYQYINYQCHLHFHLKCIKCGVLIHLNCKDLEKVENHIQNEHHFKIDNSRSTIYGFCSNCIERG